MGDALGVRHFGRSRGFRAVAADIGEASQTMAEKCVDATIRAQCPTLSWCRTNLAEFVLGNTCAGVAYRHLHVQFQRVKITVPRLRRIL